MFKINRSKGAFIVLVLSVVIAGAGFFVNTRSASDVSNKIELSIEMLEKGDNDAAKLYAESALKSWNKNTKKMMLFSSHNKMDQIDETLNIAVSDIKNNETDMFRSEATKAITLLKHLKELEYPTLSNIF